MRSLCTIVFCLLLCRTTGAIITLGGSGRNLTPPTDSRRACWELQGEWQEVLGTPIAARWFVTAAHTGGRVGDIFTIGGKLYVTVALIVLPRSDIALWRVDRPFPRWATLSQHSEVGHELFLVGRGTARGEAIPGHGWTWGASDTRQSWGRNHCSRILYSETVGPLLTWTFDADGGPDEGSVSRGDSGGAAFVQEADGTWALAGLHYDVDPLASGDDQVYSRSGRRDDTFDGALFDARGLYRGPRRALRKVDGKVAQPTLSAASQLSARRAEILATLARPDSDFPAHPPLWAPLTRHPKKLLVGGLIIVVLLGGWRWRKRRITTA